MPLFDWQQPHFERLCEILARNYFAIDISDTGRGKTIAWLAVAKHFNFPIYAVSTRTAADTTWRRHAATYNVECLGTTSYQGLRSTRGHHPTHGLLYRHDAFHGNIQGEASTTEVAATGDGKTERSEGQGGLVGNTSYPQHGSTGGETNEEHGSLSSHGLVGDAPHLQLESDPPLAIPPQEQSNGGGGLVKCTFSPTPYLISLIKSGVLFLFDEYHNIRNDTDQFEAVKVIIDTIRAIGGASRFGLLDATPLDNSHQIVRLLYLTGYIDAPALSHYNHYTRTRQVNHEQFHKLVTAATAIDEELVASMDMWACDISGVPRVGSLATCEVEVAAVRLFLEVIKPTIMSAMIAPETGLRNEVVNYEADMSEEDLQKLQAGIGYLQRSVRFVSNNEARVTNHGMICRATMAIEEAKRPTLARLLRKRLTENPNVKCIAFVNYIETIDKLAEELAEFDPLVLRGDVAPKKRTMVIDAFDRHDDDYRLIIANPKVGGVSIDLHDTHGEFPRGVIIIPSFNYIEMLQSIGRADRTGVMSDTRTLILYGKGTKEYPILRALNRKSIVLRAMANGAREEKTLYDIPTVVESESPAFW
jgi:hypothetical protein